MNLKNQNLFLEGVMKRLILDDGLMSFDEEFFLWIPVFPQFVGNLIQYLYESVKVLKH